MGDRDRDLLRGEYERERERRRRDPVTITGGVRERRRRGERERERRPWSSTMIGCDLGRCFANTRSGDDRRLPPAMIICGGDRLLRPLKRRPKKPRPRALPPSTITGRDWGRSVIMIG